MENKIGNAGLVLLIFTVTSLLTTLVFLPGYINEWSGSTEYLINETITLKKTFGWTWSFTYQDISFLNSCPDIGIISKNHQDILSFQDNIISDQHQIIYKIIIGGTKCISFYANQTFIGYTGCLYSTEGYNFFSAANKLIATSYLKGDDWGLKPLTALDLRLYGAFLSYRSFADTYDGCNIYFISIIFINCLLWIIYLIIYCLNKRD